MRYFVGFFMLVAVGLGVSGGVRPVLSQGLPEKDGREKSAARILQKAHKAADKGDYQRALKLLAPYARASRRHAALYSDYIVFHFWAGQAEKAIRLYESLPDDFPRRPYLMRNIAKAYFDQQAFYQAADLYADVVRLLPEDVIAKQGLIASLFQLKRFDRAESLLRQWVAADPDQGDLKLLWMESLFHTGNYMDAFHQFHRLADFQAVDPARAEQRLESLVVDIDPEMQEKFEQKMKSAAAAGRLPAAGDYLFVLILQRRYDRAVRFLEASSFSIDQLPDLYLYWAGWAYFKENRPAAAESVFNTLISRNPAYVRGHIGRAYVHAAQGDVDKALQDLNAVKARSDRDILEQRYAYAYVYEKAGRFAEAVAVYDTILADYPANRTAAKLRLNAMSDMGMTSGALSRAADTLPGDGGLIRSLKARKAVHYIQWEEPEKAVRFLAEELRQEPKSALRFEFIAALAAAGRHAEAIAVFEELVEDGDPIPAWVLERGAACYLEEEKPEKALKRYEQALRQEPGMREARMGKFYALQDLRKWREAEQVLDDMEQDTRPVVETGRSRKSNPDMLELQIARGWMLAGEGRLRDADAYFETLRLRAPANLDIRNGRAHVFSWRGWKRKALDAFRIMESMDPEYVSLQPGKIAVLSELAHKEDARRRLAQWMQRYPYDKRFRNVDRSFAVEGMHEILAEIDLQRESDGTNDFFLQLTGSTPYSLYTRLHAFQMWRRTWNTDLTAAQKAAGEDEPAYFRRAGLGLDHIFNRTWELRQQFSFDYIDGGDFGSYTRLRIKPDDHWRVDAIVDTFTIDVPARARIRDVTAVKTSLDTVYRESEWREYSLLIGRQWFSDGNDRDELLAGISQYIYVKNDWKMRLSGYAYGVANSAYDDPEINYFNPKSAWGLSITHMTEQILWQRYDRYFIHRLFLSAGNYRQDGYASAFTGSVRYEQDHALTDTHHLMGALRFGRNVYDGSPVNNGALELMYRWRF